MVKHAVLTVSFGTSYPDVLKSCIEATEKEIYAALPSFEPCRAFTSKIIMRKLAQRDGLLINNPQEDLTVLKEKGFTRVVVQPLHIIPGSEYHQLKATVDEFIKDKVFDSLALGEPLLYNNEDYSRAAEALKFHLPTREQGTGFVLMGHGTSHFSNACYYCLQDYLEDAGLNAYIANVEGSPALAKIVRKLKMQGTRRVVLMPFMLVAGDHARHDMSGGKDSWEDIFKKEGFQVEAHMHGLGEKKMFRNIFVQKALKAAEAM